MFVIIIKQEIGTDLAHKGDDVLLVMPRSLSDKKNKQKDTSIYKK